jgi:putative hydrolase of HD superfamily
MQPGQRWKELDAPYYPLPSTDDLAQMVERRRIAIETGDLPTPRTSLAITDRSSDALFGTVTWYWESEATLWPGVGIVIFDPAWWGRGIGYEALGLWSDYLFASLPRIVRLDLRTWSGNMGMLRLALKLGYREEACFRRARIVNGAYYDGLGYGVLRDEWHVRYPQGFATHLSNW